MNVNYSVKTRIFKCTKGCVILTALRNFAITLILSLVIFGLIGYGLIQFAFSAFSLDGEDDAGSPVTEETTGIPDTENGPVNPNDWLDIKGESYTILIVGTDHRPSVYEDYTLPEEAVTEENGFPKEPRQIKAETIILMRVNKETGECIYCAIPENTRVTVNGTVTYMLEEIYAEMGIKALKEKVMTLTGIPVDYYLTISVENFIKAIDKLGGITYNVKQDISYVDEATGEVTNIRRGSQLLKGKKAAALLCFDGYDDGDVSRRNCAVEFLRELFKKVMVKEKYADAIVLYNKYSQYFETDFKIKDVEKNIDLIYSYSKMNIQTYTYPGITSGEGDEAYFSANVPKATEFFGKYKFKG